MLVLPKDSLACNLDIKEQGPRAARPALRTNQSPEVPGWRAAHRCGESRGAGQKRESSGLLGLSSFTSHQQQPGGPQEEGLDATCPLS